MTSTRNGWLTTLENLALTSTMRSQNRSQSRTCRTLRSSAGSSGSYRSQSVTTLWEPRLTLVRYWTKEELLEFRSPTENCAKRTSSSSRQWSAATRKIESTYQCQKASTSTFRTTSTCQHKTSLPSRASRQNLIVKQSQTHDEQTRIRSCRRARSRWDK